MDEDGKVHILPDGSGFAVMSYPLPKDHWLTEEIGEFETPPMGLKCGTNEKITLELDRQEFAERIRSAAKYAIRVSTYNGKEMDFDPDAMVQNFIVGLIGYWTNNGLSNDEWANPAQYRR